MFLISHAANNDVVILQVTSVSTDLLQNVTIESTIDRGRGLKKVLHQYSSALRRTEPP